MFNYSAFLCSPVAVSTMSEPRDAGSLIVIRGTNGAPPSVMGTPLCTTRTAAKTVTVLEGFEGQTSIRDLSHCGLVLMMCTTQKLTAKASSLLRIRSGGISVT